jgi:tRNA nucleotidyltransferase/poly(A) polymerase
MSWMDAARGEGQVMRVVPPDEAARWRAWAAGWPELPRLLALAGHRPVHLVGGAVRDLLLGGAPTDADLVLPEGVPPLARRLADEAGAALVPLHDDPPTVRLVARDGRTLDLAAYRGPDLAADLRARDFTVNALAVDARSLVEERPLAILDPTGGLADLGRGLVRATHAGIFRDDPLRLLRAYRLWATRGWRPAPATHRLVRRHRRRLGSVAVERIAAELLLILDSARAATVVRTMAADGVLRVAWPELPVGPGRRASAVGPALRRLGWARRNLAALVGADRAARLADALAVELSAGRPRSRLLGWLAPVLATGSRAGATPAALERLVTASAARLCAGRREEREARAVARALVSGDLLRPTRERLGQLGEAAPGAVLLAWALDGQPAAADRLRAALDLYWAVVAPLLAAPPLVDGAQLIAALGIAPGPAVGAALAAIRTARLRGEIGTPEEALRLARRLAGAGENPHRDSAV